MQLVIEFPDVILEDVKLDLWNAALGVADGLILFLDGLQQFRQLMMDDFGIHAAEIFQVILYFCLGGVKITDFLLRWN